MPVPAQDTMKPTDDPFDEALRPPENETLEERNLRLAREEEARVVSQAIDASIKAERQARRKKRIVRLLLLGQSESGKCLKYLSRDIAHTSLLTLVQANLLLCDVSDIARRYGLSGSPCNRISTSVHSDCFSRRTDPLACSYPAQHRAIHSYDSRCSEFCYLTTRIATELAKISSPQLIHPTASSTTLNYLRPFQR